MKTFITNEIKDMFKTDTSIDQIIEIFQCFIEQFDKKSIVFESFVMFNDKSNYFLASLYTNIIYQNMNIQIRLDLKYNVKPLMYLLQNLYYSDREDNFWDKIKNTNAIKYIFNENLKPFDISILEIEI